MRRLDNTSEIVLSDCVVTIAVAGSVGGSVGGAVDSAVVVERSVVEEVVKMGVVANVMKVVEGGKEVGAWPG